MLSSLNMKYEDGHVHLPDVADTGLAVLAVLGVFKAASIVPGCFDFCGYCFGITLLSRLLLPIVVFFKVILIIPGLPASLPGLLTCGFLNHWLTIFIFSKLFPNNLKSLPIMCRCLNKENI